MYTKRNIAAAFMVLLVAWDMLEFALQPNRRPFNAEVAISITTLLVLVMIPVIGSLKPRAALVSALFCLPQFIFGLIGTYNSPLDQGFGKYGPAVAALLSGLAAAYALMAYKESKRVA